MSEWQPISTAPKDGTFLVYCPDANDRKPYGSGHSNISVMTTNGRFAIVDAHFAFDMDKPTHWMPLPTPPAASKER